MRHTPYDVYKTFKTVESDVKRKKTSVLAEDAYKKRISSKNQEIHKQASDLFNTKFSNVLLEEYIRCGFKHYKGFGFDKFFREVVLNEYIGRDSRLKRNAEETLATVLKSLKYIDQPIEKYLMLQDGNQKMIIQDYIFNNVTSTVVVWSIWRDLWEPTTVEWEYMNVIQNNWSSFEKNVVKYATMLDKWRVNMKGKK